MLKGIDPRLSPEVLHALAAMGHGDALVIADANFPAAAIARRLHNLQGLDATAALEAVLTLLPIDQYVAAPAAVMAVVDDPESVPAIVREFQSVLDRAQGARVNIEKVERFAFYERAQRAFAVIATSERRLYGNIILSKGVVVPEGSHAHS